MPNAQEDTSNYEHIKALVRDLHITRNVSRPDHSANVNGNNTQHIVKPTAISIAQQLIVHQLSTLNGPCRATIEPHKNFIEEDETSDTNTSSLDLSLSSPASLQTQCNNNTKRTKGTISDAHFSIPSVIITDVNEPLDLITSTQRRFSQLYSGLRRFSTSHTVGMTNTIQSKKPILISSTQWSIRDT